MQSNEGGHETGSQAQAQIRPHQTDVKKQTRVQFITGFHSLKSIPLNQNGAGSVPQY